MFAYSWFELQRKIKNPRTLFVILLIFILSFQKIGDYNIKLRKSINDRLYNKGKSIEGIAENELNIYTYENTYLSDEIINAYKLMENIGINMKMAAKNNDYQEYNRLSCFGNLLVARSIVVQQNKLREMSFKKQVMDMWNDVSGGVQYDDVVFREARMGRLHFYYMFLMEAKHDYTLYKENLAPIDPYHLDSVTFIYIYLSEVLPLILGFVILILTFDNINEEWNNGSFKIALTNIFSRNRYIISKIIVGVLYTVFVVSLPAAIISLGYGFFNGFNNYNYPVLYLKKGFQALSSIPNFIEFDKGSVGYNPSIGLSLYSGIPKGEMGISNKLTLMPLYKFLLLSFILLIFCIVFYVALNTLISSMVKNKVIGFIIPLIITISGTVISKPLTMNEHYNLSPFSMNNPVRILNGTYNVTALAASLVLIGASLLLIFLNLSYYKNKDL